jgi:hypothetical protein
MDLILILDIEDLARKPAVAGWPETELLLVDSLQKQEAKHAGGGGNR